MKIKLSPTVVCIFVLFIVFLLSLCIGRVQIPVKALFPILGPHTPGLANSAIDQARTILLNIRLPRVIGAFLLGVALSLAGAVLQSIFQNPLVSPFLLGVSQGAGFGAALAIMLFGAGFATQWSAFAFALISVVLSVFLSRKGKGRGSISLILAGVIIGNLFAALLSGVKLMVDSYNKLPAIIFWLMGSLSSAGWQEIGQCIPVISLSALMMLMLRWKVFILSLGDDDSLLVGLEANRAKMLLILLSSVCTASAVSYSGVVGWVGLVMPHISRMLVKTNYRQFLPVSALLGGIFTLVADTLARSLFPFELPLGIVTTIIGTPLFILTYGRTKDYWLV